MKKGARRLLEDVIRARSLSYYCLARPTRPAACAAFVVLLFHPALVNLRASLNSLNFAIHLGALVACAGLLAHGLADFNLHIPSNAILFFLQVALASTPAPAARESAYS